MDINHILYELQIFISKEMGIPLSEISVDKHFSELQLDSMSHLEILLYADDTFGSHVLDYLEEGLLGDKRPNSLRELVLLIPDCMIPVSEFAAKKKSNSLNSN